ncbi:Type IV secretory pathway, partial [Bifidobacterium lemurum]
MRARRLRGRVCAILLALAALLSLASCSAPDFDNFSDSLRFGDEEIADVQTVYSMRIEAGGLGALIGPNQIAWAEKQYAAGASQGGVTVRQLLVATPSLQCEALEHTYQEETEEEGPWEWNADTSSCDKTRTLSWLEKTLWHMYEKQSEETIEWLSTSRNTLTASDDTVSTLRSNAAPMYDEWDTGVNRYLRVAQGILVVAAAISLTVLGARIVWRIGNGDAGGMDGQLLGKVGWIFLGVFLGSSCASIALTFFTRASTSGGSTTPALQSWTPSGAYTPGGIGFYVSDWIRMQVDPLLLIAAVCGVLAAGFKLVTNQEGRELVPLGKAFVWAMVTAVCLAGFVNLFQATVDSWTASILRAASSMMADAWDHNTLAASEFFDLDGAIALLLTLVVWLCGLIGKIFAYLRAGLLPILVGVAPMWAAMSWMETGRQAFAKVMGWLVAFLLYKPVAAIVMATGCAIMVTAGDGDDSQAITLMLTISVIVLL